MKVFKVVLYPVVVALLFAITISSCKTSSKSAQTDKQLSDSDSLFVSLDRSPCFGSCPTYTVNIYQSGYAIYKGKNAVSRLGTYEARFTRDQLKLFSEAAMDYRVDTLQSEYVDPFIADFPATYSSINLKGKQHTFKVSTDAPPESLTSFEAALERLIELPQWKKISDKAE